MPGACKMLLSLCLIASLSLSAADVHGGGWLMPAVRSGCSGTIAEFELDSESNRRILASRRFISYGALMRNNVPCSRRGASYYNCRPGSQANPYFRGCSRITRCRI